MMGLKTPGESGFSLVEIAIVLVVVGLLISGGLLGLAPVLQNNKTSKTNDQLDRIEQALVLYVIQNGCLPCPAVPGTTMSGQSSYDTGTESATGCTTSTACDVAQGVVPWVNLGLSRDDVIDAYGFFIDYVPSPSLTQTSSSMVRTPPATYPVGNRLVDNAAGTDQTTAGAYVLISHGSDGSNAYQPANGGVKSDPNNATDQAPNSRTTVGAGTGDACGATPCVQNQTLPTQGTGYFDDIVRFKTAPVIIQSCGSNACGNPA